MIDKMSGRIALLVVVVAVVVIAVLGWLVLLSPERAKASKLDGQVRDTNSQLAAVTELLNGPVGKQSLEALKNAKIAVPDNPQMSQIIRQLADAAGKAGVSLEAIGPETPVAAGTGEAIPMSITVNGRYFAIRNFFKILRTKAQLVNDKLQATGRLFTIDTISFTGSAATAAATGGEGGSSSNVAATFIVSAYAGVAGPGVTPAVTTTTSSDTGTTTTP